MYRGSLLVTLAIVLSSPSFAEAQAPSGPLLERVTPEQAAWWERNRERAVYIESRGGFHVPGTPGFFDQAGRPLTDSARQDVRQQLSRYATTGPEDDGEGIPIDFGFLNRNGEPRRAAAPPTVPQGPPIAPSNVQLTPAQAQWWEANRQRATFVPGQGFQVPGEPGFFDPYGRKLPAAPSAAAAPRVAAASVPVQAPVEPVRRSVDDEDEYDGIGIGEGGFEDYMQRFRGADGGAPEDYEGVKLVPWQKDPPPSEGAARKLFEAGERAFKDRDYDTAADKFQAAARAMPKSSIEEDALFMKAESEFFADRYPVAFDTYEKLVEKFKRSRHLDKTMQRLFAIGQYWIKLHMDDPQWLTTPNLTDRTRPRYDTLGHGLRAFDRVRLTDPTGPLADDTLIASGNVYFVRKYYEDAAYYYGLLIDEYPQSDKLYTAFQLGIQSKLRSYQGPNYDSKPLEDAQKWIDQAIASFPDQQPEDRERLVKHRAEVEIAMAQRDYARGKYYENLNYAGAARYYYAQVVKKYPRSPMSQQAQERIASLQGTPDAPDEKFEWLSYVFPDKPAGPTIVAESPETGSDGPIRR